MVREEQLYRGKGSGSRSAMGDVMVGDKWDSKDQRAGTHTTFYTKDIDSLSVSKGRKQCLKRILRLQEGEHQNSKQFASRGSQNHREDKRRFVGAMCSQLSVTPAQKKRIEHLVMDVLDINSYGMYSTEKVILSVINVVVREDGRYIEEESKFQELMGNVGIVTESEKPDLRRMRRLRELTRERLPSK